MKKWIGRGFVFFAVLILGLLPVVAQAGDAKFNAGAENYLTNIAIADDIAALAKWIAQNSGGLNGNGPGGRTSLEICLRNGAIKCFAALLDAGANPNARFSGDKTFDLILLVQAWQTDTPALLHEFSQALISHGCRLDGRYNLNGIDAGLAAIFIAMLSESSDMINQFYWLAQQGMDVSQGIAQGYRSVTLMDFAKQVKKPKFAEAIPRAEAAAKAAASAKQAATDSDFTSKGAALASYSGPDKAAENTRLLSNPNAFDPGSGYYFGNVIPDVWLARDKVTCHSEDLTISGRNQGRSAIFLIFIEDPALRRAFTPTTLTSPSTGETLKLGFDVILVPYEDPVFTTWAGFKLVAMKSAKLNLGF